MTNLLQEGLHTWMVTFVYVAIYTRHLRQPTAVKLWGENGEDLGYLGA